MCKQWQNADDFISNWVNLCPSLFEYVSLIWEDWSLHCSLLFEWFIFRPYSIHRLYSVCFAIKFFSRIHFSSKDTFKSCTYFDQIYKQKLGLIRSFSWNYISKNCWVIFKILLTFFVKILTKQEIVLQSVNSSVPAWSPRWR